MHVVIMAAIQTVMEFRSLVGLEPLSVVGDVEPLPVVGDVVTGSAYGAVQYDQVIFYQSEIFC